MKTFMIFINFVMFLLITLLIFVHFIHQAPEPEKVLSMTPSNPTNTVTPPIQTQPPFKLPSVDNFVKKNIFHPDRGKKPEVPTTVVPPTKKENMELVGTFKYGDKLCAIIREQTPAKKDPADQKKVKRVFSQNDILPNGCLLKQVESKSVTLEQNGVEFKLEVDFDDSKSKERMGKVMKIKDTPTVIATAQTGKAPLQAPNPIQKPGTIAPPMPPKPGEDDLAAINAPIPVHTADQPAVSNPPQSSPPKSGRRFATPSK